MESKKKLDGRVLLVDNDGDVLRDYQKLLASLVSIVETATDGTEAVERIRNASFDVIVSNIAMPRMGGLDFLRAVREHDLDVPVVLITGQPGLETAIEAVEYGAFRYLIKPVLPETLEDTLRQAMAMHRMARLKREALEVVGAEGKWLGDRAALEARFEKALQLLWVAFQPIVRYSERQVFGYEALIRSEEPTLAQPGDLFDSAERLGRVHELGRAIRNRIAQAASKMPDDVTLFVNIHTAELNDFELYSPKTLLSSMARRVALEITERFSMDAVKGLGTKVAKLRKMGFRIAVDNFGAGYAGLATFTQLEPDFVKLDPSLVRGIDLSSRKQSIVRAMLHLCGGELQMMVIGKGIETTKERDAMIAEGADLLQGVLFARPDRRFLTPTW